MAKPMQTLATARMYNLRKSPHKLRLLADLVRGKRVEEALTLLKFNKKLNAEYLEQLIRSAVANLEQKEGANYDPDRLFISKLLVDEGPTMYRFRAMSMGRAGRIRKRTSHILVELGQPVDKLSQAKSGGAKAKNTEAQEA